MKGGEVHTQPPYPRRQLGPRVSAATAGRGWASFYWPIIGVELMPWVVVMVQFAVGLVRLLLWTEKMFKVRMRSYLFVTPYFHLKCILVPTLFVLLRSGTCSRLRQENWLNMEQVPDCAR